MRKPACHGCGKPKGPGAGRRYCDDCRQHKCIVCGQPTSPVRKTCGDECLRESHTSNAFKAITQRRLNYVPRPLPAEQVCSRCKVEFPLTTEFFCSERRDLESGEVTKFARWCKSCKSTYARERHARRTPEEIERDREYNRASYELRRQLPEVQERDREAKRRWRARNRERLAEASQRYFAKLKEDPERHAQFLINQRIAYRLRQQEQGREVTSNPKALESWKPAMGKSADLPIAPLSVWLDALLHEDGRDRSEIASVMGVNERTLWRIQNREYHKTTASLADTLLWHYGRSVLIRSAKLEGELVNWARELPGNGTRLLRYLDEAEKVAHLGDVSVSRIEDLWPHLEDE